MGQTEVTGVGWGCCQPWAQKAKLKAVRNLHSCHMDRRRQSRIWGSGLSRLVSISSAAPDAERQSALT